MENDPGGGRDSGVMVELPCSNVLSRLGEQLNSAIPATCACGESYFFLVIEAICLRLTRDMEKWSPKSFLHQGNPVLHQ